MAGIRSKAAASRWFFWRDSSSKLADTLLEEERLVLHDRIIALKKRLARLAAS